MSVRKFLCHFFTSSQFNFDSRNLAGIAGRSCLVPPHQCPNNSSYMICSKGEHELVEGRSKFGFPLQHLLGNVVHLLGVPVDAPRCADERLEAAIARLPVCVDEPHAELDNAVVPPVEAGRPRRTTRAWSGRRP